MNFFEEIPETWLNILDHDIVKRTQDKLNASLNDKLNDIFPKKSDIFKVFRLLSPDKIRVVILGQDPYYADEKQANGIAFDVNAGTKCPPSLRNIFKEVSRVYPNANLNISSWVNQGVFMLNAFLTVIRDKPGSHRSIWQEFTDHIIHVVSVLQGTRIFVLWGKFAENKKLLIDEKNIVFVTSHPSPLSCYKTETPFNGSDIFQRINDALGNERIEW